MRCINPHNTPVTLNAGITVRVFSTICSDQVYEGEENSKDTEESNSPTVTSDIPEHLRTLYEEAVKNRQSEKEESALKGLLQAYQDVFSTSDSNVGLTDLIMHSIPTLLDVQPIKQPPRQLRVEEEAEVERQVSALVEKDMVEPARATRWFW